MNAPVSIAIVADFNSASRSHIATNDALAHSAKALGLNLEPTWVPTSDLADGNTAKRLAGFAGLWIGPGSPYASMDGALSAIRLARERNVGEIVCNFNLSQPTISRHLSVLKDADLVIDQRKGQNVIYRLNDEVLSSSLLEFFARFASCQAVLR